MKREKFLPDINNKSFENVVGTRLTLEVQYDEYAPQCEPTEIDLLYVKCVKDSVTGQIYFEGNYDMTE
jgi:hypothetical protein